MPKVAVLAGGQLDCLPDDFDIYVGVDGGCLALLAQGRPINLAVGDFDSVTPEQFQEIEQAATQLIGVQPEKDDTDLSLALTAVFEAWPTADVMVYGALGGRLDHTLANVFLASDPQFSSYLSQIHLIDRYNRVDYYPCGRHQIKPQAGFSYLAFMPADNSRLTIRGAKYPLNESNYFFKKCYTSNEFLDDDIMIELDSGYVVVIFSKDQK